MAIEIKNMVNIKVKIDKNIEQKAIKFETAVSDFVTKNLLDVEKGKDIFGNTFDDYNPKYEAWRKEIGKRGNPPNLRLSGNMMKSLNYRMNRLTNQFTAIIGFSDNSAKVKGNLQKRKFFGLTKEALDKIKKRVGGT